MTSKELLARAKELNIKGRHDMAKEDLETAVRQREILAAPKKNLVKRTNIPWKKKYYYLDVDRYSAMQDQVKKAATQVQLILKSMEECGTTNPNTSEMGGTICSNAIRGGLRTKIEPHVLFAYYRATMEDLGLVFAGYNID